MAFLARIGSVLYGLAWLIALMLFAAMAWSGVTPTLSTLDQWTFGILGLGFLAAGRVVYFLLSGR